jgi:hypothetical protein
MLVVFKEKLTESLGDMGAPLQDRLNLSLRKMKVADVVLVMLEGSDWS